MDNLLIFSIFSNANQDDFHDKSWFQAFFYDFLDYDSRMRSIFLKNDFKKLTDNLFEILSYCRFYSFSFMCAKRIRVFGGYIVL